MEKCMRQLGKACCWFLLYFLLSNAVAFLPVLAYFTVAAICGAIPDPAVPFSSYPNAYSDVIYLSNILSLPFFLFAIYVIARSRNERLRDTINFSYVAPWKLVFPLLLGITLQPFVNILLSVLPIPERLWEGFNETVMHLDDRSLFGVIATVLIAPVMEELILRGLIFERLRRGMPMVLALLLQAAVFGALHGNWIQGSYAFLLGIMMGLIYLKYDSIWASVLFHLGFNGTSYYIYATGDMGRTAMFILFAVSAALSVLLAVVIGLLHVKKRTGFLSVQSGDNV